jgi:hypothetical protein
MSPRRRKSLRDLLRCTFCGASELIEEHHVGLRNHAPLFTLPLCQQHHREIHRLLEGSGVDMRSNTNKLHRIGWSLKALAVFLYRLAEELLKNED